VVIGLLFFTGAAFLRNFLKVKDHSVRVDRILAVLQWMGLVYPVVIIVTPDVVRYIYSLVLFLIGPIFSTTVSIGLGERRAECAVFRHWLVYRPSGRGD
jgi:hypothetical protein